MMTSIFQWLHRQANAVALQRAKRQSADAAGWPSGFSHMVKLRYFFNAWFPALAALPATGSRSVSLWSAGGMQGLDRNSEAGSASQEATGQEEGGALMRAQVPCIIPLI